MSRFDPPAHTPIARITLGIGAGGLTLFAAFFVLYANGLDTDPPPVAPADGLVVFTGMASERIRAGLTLLHAEKGKRLLVSGVYAPQNVETILALAPPNSNLRCCIDVDYEARNTVQNARETAKWARIFGFESLVIITSAHHMPRAFLEMRRAAPTVRLSAYPVVPANVHFSSWWRYPGTTLLLLGEYIRYLWALSGLPGTDTD